MDIDFNEFLRIMSCILIVLLVFQGLDYIVGFGINNYIFIVFCIVFAFTMGSIYFNIIAERKRKYEQTVYDRLDIVQSLINEEFEKSGLTDEVLQSQLALNRLRDDLGLVVKDNVVDLNFDDEN